MRRQTIGLTGGFGSGKSTVLKEFKRLGAVTADADEIARRVVRQGGPAYGKAVRLLGREMLLPNGELNRPAVADRIFKSQALRRRLEGIIHPLVRQEMQSLARKTRGRLIVLDIPLLFESKMTNLVDRIVVVWAPEKVRIARTLKEGRFSRADILRRLSAQMPLAMKCRKADHVIDNTGSLAHARAQIKRHYEQLVALL